jgi:aryl-alcohol dehydrogenase-like predicted oxidoreductase
MEYRLLGRTAVQVSPRRLGTMTFGAWGDADHDDSVRVIHSALDAGISFIDTADVYPAGVSEDIVGKAFEGGRDDVILATKFFMPMGKDPNRRGGSRRWIVQAVEDSLQRLGADYIDLYQVHRPSPDIDIEDTLGTLTDVVGQGKVRYIGWSSYSGSQIVEAQWTARERRSERFTPAFRCGARLRHQPPWRDLGDHRPPHDGAAGQASCLRPTSSSTSRRWIASTRSSTPP